MRALLAEMTPAFRCAPTLAQIKIDWRSGFLVEHDLFGIRVSPWAEHHAGDGENFGPNAAVEIIIKSHNARITKALK